MSVLCVLCVGIRNHKIVDETSEMFPTDRLLTLFKLRLNRQLGNTRHKDNAQRRANPTANARRHCVTLQRSARRQPIDAR
jgi:hypothetical protein